MRSIESFCPKDWKPGVRLTMERAGQAILGKGRLELLEAVGRWRSISGAARKLGISYRHAWLTIQSINEAAGEPLVVATTGGTRGGGAQLTTLGRWAVELFREMQDQLQQTASNLMGRLAPSRSGVHVAAAVCLEEVLGRLLADFALQQPGVRVRVVFGASDELAEHVLAGAPTDLFISASADPLDRLQAVGMADPKTRTVLAENTLAAIGPEGRRSSVHRSADLAQPSVARIALADPACPLGRYTQDYLKAQGLYEVVAPRAIYVDNSRAVGATVRGGSADVGMVYGSDAQAGGCRVLFIARKGPSPIQISGAVIRGGDQTDQARSLLCHLASGGSALRFRRCGFLPIR